MPGRRVELLTVGILGMTAVLAAAQAVSPPQSVRPTSENNPSQAVIGIDQSHRNSPYRGFSELLESDGYQVRQLAATLSSAALADVQVLVISHLGGVALAEAARAKKSEDEQAIAVRAASLSNDEVSAVISWVRNGGALMLTVDQAPYPLAAAKLTNALGVRNWGNGRAGVLDAGLCTLPGPECSPAAEVPVRFIDTIFFWRPDTFPGGRPGLTLLDGPAKRPGYQGADAILGKHEITDGRGASERVQRVVTIAGGSAFQPPTGSQPLLTLPERALLRRAGMPDLPIGGWLQGAVMPFGKGRVALFADESLFSGGAAVDNRRFTQNVIRWLSRGF